MSKNSRGNSVFTEGRLSLGEGAFHPRPEQGNFAIFDDSAPDRWGQMLMRRREALAANMSPRSYRSPNQC